MIKSNLNSYFSHSATLVQDRGYILHYSELNNIPWAFVWYPIYVLLIKSFNCRSHLGFCHILSFLQVC